MRFLSVCSGIEAASVAWEGLGWEAAGFSEIEPFPCAVLSHHYPTVRNFGSLLEHETWDTGPVDLLVGGTPCQSFSVAGLRKGLDDARGNLALEYVRLAARLRPRWVVWENVPGVLSSSGGRDFGSILGALVELGYGFAYRVLDAQYFGVAQRRRRVFLVGYAGDWRRAAAVLFESESVPGNPSSGRKTRKGTSMGAVDSAEAGVRDPVGTLCSDTHPGAYSGQDAYTGRIVPDCGGGGLPQLSRCLNAGGMGRQDYETETLIPVGGFFDLASSGVRRLTPTECERLQGFPDGYTAIPWKKRPASECPDGPRYKALGNSMAVPVMRWIGERIAKVDAL